MNQEAQIEKNYYAKEDIILYKIPPQLTDEKIDNWLDSHQIAFQLNRQYNPKLFLFLGGSFGKPGQQNLFLKEVVNLGYIVIQLNYPNSWTIANLCQNSSNYECHEKTRQAIIYGQKNSHNIIINRANSLENRLVKLLLFLSKNIPEINWLNYLNADETPRWILFVIAGHSQGGGHAAMIAKQNVVDRIIMFASPSDYSKIQQDIAPWLSSPSLTSTEKYYGFIHFQDQSYNQVIKAWQKLGLGNHGNLVNVDSTDISSINSHQLVTNYLPRTKNKFHGSIISDLHTPRNRKGNPIYRKIWQYLCTNNY
jgi:hypothetical protein